MLAEKKGIPRVIIPGAEGSLTLRNIKDRNNTEGLDIETAGSIILGRSI
jgi:hypothetical protein